MSNIRFLNRGKTGEIWLYDQVGAGDFFSNGMSAKQFADELNKLGKIDLLNLRINSPGGSVFDGVAIYNILDRFPGRIEVDVDGVAASIASVIAMAGDEIRMASNALMMIHDPMGYTQGGAEDMRQTADLLDQIKGIIVDTYARRTKNEASVLGKMMTAETWMTAADALNLGFADSTTAEQKIAACYGFDWTKYKHPPQSLAGGSRPARDMHAVKLVHQASVLKV